MEATRELSQKITENRLCVYFTFTFTECLNIKYDKIFAVQLTYDMIYWNPSDFDDISFVSADNFATLMRCLSSMNGSSYFLFVVPIINALTD